MKKILIPVLICLVSVIGIISYREPTVTADVNANCEPIPGTIIPTNFTGTAPSSVAEGETFSLKNITSSAANTLPVTITSSDLKLSATHASETTYLKGNTSSVVDPNTGFKRAIFPDWQIKATGKAGDKIVIKIVEATAHVENVGPITCALSQTLATIDITSPASTGGTNTTPSPKTPTNNSGGTNKPPEETKPEETKPEESKPDVQTDQAATPEKEATHSIRVIVKDEKDNFLGGVALAVKDSKAVTSYTDGSAVIEGLAPGQHKLEVSYKNTTIHRSIYVTTANHNNVNNIVMPVQTGVSFQVFFAVTASLFALTSVFVTTRLF